jgi:hypothetical protein
MMANAHTPLVDLLLETRYPKKFATEQERIAYERGVLAAFLSVLAEQDSYVKRAILQNIKTAK